MLIEVIRINLNRNEEIQVFSFVLFVSYVVEILGATSKCGGMSPIGSLALVSRIMARIIANRTNHEGYIMYLGIIIYSLLL